MTSGVFVKEKVEQKGTKKESGASTKIINSRAHSRVKGLECFFYIERDYKGFTVGKFFLC